MAAISAGCAGCARVTSALNAGKTASAGFSVVGVAAAAPASPSPCFLDLPAPSNCASFAFNLSCFSASARSSSSCRRFFASSRFSRMIRSCTLTGSSSSGAPASGRGGICCAQVDCCENTGGAGSILAIVGEVRMSCPITVLVRLSGAGESSGPLVTDMRLTGGMLPWLTLEPRLRPHEPSV